MFFSAVSPDDEIDKLVARQIGISTKPVDMPISASADMEIARQIAMQTPCPVSQVLGVVRSAYDFGFTREQILAFGPRIALAVDGARLGFSIDDMLPMTCDQLSSAVGLAESVLSFARFIDVDIEKVKREIRLAHLTV